MRCSSSLPPVLTTVRDGKGSTRITDAESSIHLHRAHHGQEKSGSAHSVPTPTSPVFTGQPGMQQGETSQYPYHLTLAQRFDAFIPTQLGVASHTPGVGCNGWTMPDLEYVDKTIAKCPTGASEAPRKSGHDSPTTAPSTGASTEPYGAQNPTICPMTRQSESGLLNDVNTFCSSRSFDGVSPRESELANVRHYERVALEAYLQLQGLRLQNGAGVDSVRASRLQNLENSARADRLQNLQNSARADRQRHRR